MSERKSAAPAACYPTEVRRDVDARTVRVTWHDGHVSEYPFAYLRGWCPCAACQGHGGEKHYVEGQNTELTSLNVVGRYALGLIWADGHDTGIYAYRYLRSLCPCTDCAPA